MKYSKFIALEGADATGKSSIISLLRKEKNLIAIEGMPPLLSPIKNTILEQASGRTRMLYFLACNQQTADDASTALCKGLSFITARHLWSTYAYHLAIEGRIDENVNFRCFYKK